MAQILILCQEAKEEPEEEVFIEIAEINQLEGDQMVEEEQEVLQLEEEEEKEEDGMERNHIFIYLFLNSRCFLLLNLSILCLLLGTSTLIFFILCCII